MTDAVSRADHVRWCKQRAREYLPADPAQAVTSMLSDLGKHPDTAQLAQTIGPMGLWAAQSVTEARKFIEGFTE